MANSHNKLENHYSLCGLIFPITIILSLVFSYWADICSFVSVGTAERLVLLSVAGINMLMLIDYVLRRGAYKARACVYIIFMTLVLAFLLAVNGPMPIGVPAILTYAFLMSSSWLGKSRRLLFVCGFLEPVLMIPVAAGSDKSVTVGQYFLFSVLPYYLVIFIAYMLCTFVRLRLGLQDEEIEYYRNANTELSVANSRDALTGLYNRRYYDAVIKRYMSAYDYLKTNFCLIMIDIDHFKSINDTYGHTNGDIALRAVANVLLKTIRNGEDCVCRFGGEEFAVLLKADISAAAARAEEIRTAVEKLSIKATGKFTISCGVARYRGHMSDTELCEKADKMLYAAKESGRNKTCVNWE